MILLLLRCLFAIGAVLSTAMLPERWDRRLETFLCIVGAVLCLVSLVSVK